MASISVKASPRPARRDDSEQKPARRSVRVRRLLSLLLISAAFSTAATLACMHRRELLTACLEVLRALETLGPWRGTLLLCLLQSIGFVLLIPTSFLSVAAGCAFGLSGGVAAAGAGYLFGCLLPFYLSRFGVLRHRALYCQEHTTLRKGSLTQNSFSNATCSNANANAPCLVRSIVLSATATRFVRRYPLASGILAAVEEQPFLLIVLLRLSPALPAPVNCYLLGLTRVSVQVPNKPII